LVGWKADCSVDLKADLMVAKWARKLVETKVAKWVEWKASMTAAGTVGKMVD
jgi:hypothetical protein